MLCCARSREGLDVVVDAARHELKVEDRGDLQRGVLGSLQVSKAFVFGWRTMASDLWR